MAKDRSEKRPLPKLLTSYSSAKLGPFVFNFEWGILEDLAMFSFLYRIFKKHYLKISGESKKTSSKLLFFTICYLVISGAISVLLFYYAVSEPGEETSTLGAQVIFLFFVLFMMGYVLILICIKLIQMTILSYKALVLTIQEIISDSGSSNGPN